MTSYQTPPNPLPGNTWGGRSLPSASSLVATGTGLCLGMVRLVPSSLAEIMKPLIYYCFLQYLRNLELISDHQYGFCHNRSTGHHLVFLKRYWAKANTGSTLSSQISRFAVNLTIFLLLGHLARSTDTDIDVSALDQASSKVSTVWVKWNCWHFQI